MTVPNVTSFFTSFPANWELIFQKCQSARSTEVEPCAYQALDWEIVHSIGTERLGDFVEYAREIEAVMTGTAGSES